MCCKMIWAYIYLFSYKVIIITTMAACMDPTNSSLKKPLRLFIRPFLPPVFNYLLYGVKNSPQCCMMDEGESALQRTLLNDLWDMLMQTSSHKKCYIPCTTCFESYSSLKLSKVIPRCSELRTSIHTLSVQDRIRLSISYVLRTCLTWHNTSIWSTPAACSGNFLHTSEHTSMHAINSRVLRHQSYSTIMHCTLWSSNFWLHHTV